MNCEFSGNAEEWYTTENCSNIHEDFDDDIDFNLNGSASNITLDYSRSEIIENPYYGIETHGEKLNKSFSESHLNGCVSFLLNKSPIIVQRRLKGRPLCLQVMYAYKEEPCPL